jgi:hypothetical protein
MKRDAAEQGPAVRSHDVVKPEVGAGPFARIGFQQQDSSAFGEMGVHAGHMVNEGGANVVEVQPRVNDEVDAGAMIWWAHVEAPGPRDMREDLAETPDMGRGMVQGGKGKKKKRREGQDNG